MGQNCKFDVGKWLPGSLRTIYPPCPLSLVAFSPGNTLASQVSCSNFNLPTVAISFRLSFLKDIVVGKKSLPPKRINISKVGPLTSPDGCNVFPKWQIRNTYAHMHVSGKVRTGCAWGYGDLAFWWGRGVLLQEDPGLFWMETWKEVHKL